MGHEYDAMEGWKTSLFGPCYQQTGYVVAATSRALQKAIHHIEYSPSLISSHPLSAPKIRRVNSSKILGIKGGSIQGL